MADYLLEIDAKVDSVLSKVNQVSSRIDKLVGRPYNVTINIKGNINTELDKIETKLERITNSLRAIKEFRLPALSVGGVASPVVKVEAMFDTRSIDKTLRSAQRDVGKKHIEVEVDYDTVTDAARAAKQAVADLNKALAGKRAKVQTELAPPTDIQSEVQAIQSKLNNFKAKVKVEVDYADLDRELTQVGQKINQYLINNAGRALTVPIDENRLSSVRQSLSEIPGLIDNLAAARQRYQDLGKTTSVGITDLGEKARKGLVEQAEKLSKAIVDVQNGFNGFGKDIKITYDNSDLERVKNEFNEWAAANKIVYFEFRAKNKPDDFMAPGGGIPGAGPSGGFGGSSAADLKAIQDAIVQQGVQAVEDSLSSAQKFILGRLDKTLAEGGFNKAGVIEVIKSLGGKPDTRASSETLREAAADLVRTSGRFDEVFGRLKDLRLQLGSGDPNSGNIAGQNARVFLEGFKRAFMDQSAEVAADNVKTFLGAFKRAFIDPQTASVVSETSKRFIEAFLESFVTNPSNSLDVARQFGTLDRVGDFNYRFPRNISPADRSAPNFNEILDRMARQTTEIAKASNMLRMLPERMITLDLANKANIQSELFANPEVRAAIPSGRDILFLEIKKLFTEFFRQQNLSNPWVGNAGGTPLLDRIMSAGSGSRRATPLLPGAGQTSAAVGPLSWQTSLDFARAQREFTQVVKRLFVERRQPLLPGANQTGGRGVLVGGEGAESFRARQRGNAEWLREGFRAAREAAQEFSRGAIPASSALTVFQGATQQASQAASNFANGARRAASGVTGGLGGAGGGRPPGGGSSGLAGPPGPGGGIGVTNLFSLERANEALSAAQAVAQRAALAATSVIVPGPGQRPEVTTQILDSTREAFRQLARETRLQAEAQRVYTNNLRASTAALNDQLAASRLGTTTMDSPLIRDGVQDGTVPVTSVNYPSTIEPGLFNSVRVPGESTDNRIFQSNIVGRTRGQLRVDSRRINQRIEELFEREAFGRELEDLINQLPVTSRRTNQSRLNIARRQRVGRLANESLIGGGFPLLFGAGPLSALGGGLGGLAGGLATPGGGFAGSILGSFAGQQIDTTFANIGNLANSLKAPVETLTALEQSGFRVSDSLKFLVTELERVGNSSEAQALALAEVEKRLGPGATADLNQLNAAQKQLQEQWAVIAGEIQARLLPALQALTEFIVGAAGDLSGAASQSRLQRIDPKRFEELRSQAIREVSGNAFGLSLPSEERKAAFDARLNELTKQELQNRFPKPEAPERTVQDQLESDLRRVEEERRQADLVTATKREALQLTRESYDLVEREADVYRSIGDLRRKWEKEIYDIRKRASQEEFNAVQAQAQVGIEAVRTNLLGASIGQGDEEQRLLGALSEYLTQREEGELAIEERRRQIRVQIVDLEMETAEFSITAAQEVENIERQINAYNRSVEDYKFKVAEYQLKVQREIEDSVRRSAAMQMAAAQAGLANAAGMGSGGIGGNAVFGRTGRMSLAAGYGMVDVRGSNRAAVAADAMDIIRANTARGVRTLIGGDMSGDVDATNLTGSALENAVYRGIERHANRVGRGTYAIDLIAPNNTPVGIPLSNVSNRGGNTGVAGNTARGNIALHLGTSSRSGGGMMGMPMGGASSIVDGYFRRLSYLEARGKWQVNPNNPDVQGFFQAKTPFTQEARQASGGLNVRSRDFSEATKAAQAWVQRFRPEAWAAIMRGDIALADRLLNRTWTALPGGAEAQRPQVQAEAMRLIASGSGSPLAQQLGDIQFPDQPQFNKIPLGETPDPSQITAQYREASERLRGALLQQLDAEEKINGLLEEQNALRFKAAIVGTSQVSRIQAEIDLQKEKVAYLTDINNLGLSEEEQARKFLELEGQIQKKELERLRQFSIGEAQRSGGRPEAIQAAVKLINEGFDEKDRQNQAENRKRLESLNLDILEKQSQEIKDYARELITATDEANAINAAYQSGELLLSSQAEAALEIGSAWEGLGQNVKDFFAGLVQARREAERLAENSREIAELRLEAQATGIGLRSGFIGAPGAAFQDAFIANRQAGASPEAAAIAAQGIAQAAQELENQQLIWGNLEKDIVAVSDAIATSLTQGLADIVTGARDIKDVGRELLDSIASTFLDSAQQQLSVVLQRSFAGLLGDEGGLLSKLGIGALDPKIAVEQAHTTAMAAHTQALLTSAAANGIVSTGGLLGNSLGGSLTGSLVSGVGGTVTSGIGSAVSGAISGAGGFGSIFSLPLLGFADGGRPPVGRPSIVGERGPELFIPGVSGTIVPLDDKQKAAQLRESSNNESNGTINVKYEAKEIAGERYVTEAQFRKGMARAAQQGKAMAYSGMRNSGSVRKALAIP